MNRKVVVLVVASLAVAMLATSLVSANPGDEKNNEKFAYFELVCSGRGSGVYEDGWYSPPEGDPPMNTHARGGGWITGDTVELTVEEETITANTAPYSVDYTTTYDIELHRNNDGITKGYNMRLTDVVTIYDEGVPIGTLILHIVATVDFATTPATYSGTVMGYGTDELAGVHISAVDLGVVGGVTGNLLYARVGTITGWPEQITNIT